jgi:hypothetical protein
MSLIQATSRKSGDINDLNIVMTLAVLLGVEPDAKDIVGVASVARTAETTKRDAMKHVRIYKSAIM